MTRGIVLDELPVAADVVSDAAVDPQPYASALAHLEQLFDQVRIWLRQHFERYPERRRADESETPHLYVSFSEIERFLDGDELETTTTAEELDDELAELRDSIGECAFRAALEGVSLPFEELRAAFDLSDHAIEVLLVALAPDFDPRFLRAYAAAWCDFTQPATTVGFVLELLGHSTEMREAIRRELDPDSPLIHYRLLELHTPSLWGADAPMSAKYVCVAPRISAYLRGKSDYQPALGSFVNVIRNERPVESLLLPDGLVRGLRQLLSTAYKSKGAPLRIYLHGPRGCGKRSLAAAIALEMARPLVYVDLRSAPPTKADLRHQLREIIREVKLTSGDLYIDHLDEWADAVEHREEIQALCDELAGYGGLVYIASAARLDWLDDHVPNIVDLAVPFPSTEAQRELWARFLPPDVPLGAGLSIDEIVKRYSLSAGSIAEVTNCVARRLRMTAKSEQQVTREELYTAIRNSLRHQLGDLTIPVSRAYGWDDLVLPTMTIERLRDLLSYYTHQTQIMNEWGFGEKLLHGRGLSALFSGPSGTGKTMGASIIASELGMEMFQVDLSRVVNKYIGETEKNLAKIFDEASRAQAVLFFDEADSLFAKRTEVKSSTDRYANLEVNYLLQRMEQYDGITILTTNFEAALDEAFIRRIKFRVQFPLPDEDLRRQLWASMIPDDAPREGDLGLEQLAHAFEMAGAGIKKAVIRAAIMAAEKGSPLTKEILREAANREYAEMGKLVRAQQQQRPLSIPELGRRP